MTQRWPHRGPSSAAQPAQASDGATQLSSLAGNAEQPADEHYRRARDGKLYTRVEFHRHYCFCMGETHWQNAQDEHIQRDKPAHVGALEDPRLRSDEQPAASTAGRAAQPAFGMQPPGWPGPMLHS